VVAALADLIASFAISMAKSSRDKLAAIPSAMVSSPVSPTGDNITGTLGNKPETRLTGVLMKYAG
jgi:hypothetical protein